MAGNHRTGAPRRRDLLARVGRLALRQEKLAQLISAAEELADSIRLEVEQIKAFLAAGTPIRVPERTDERAAATLRQAAQGGVGVLKIRPLPSGRKEFRIDGGGPFTLPPVLGELLGILALDAGHSDDNLVGWKSLKDLALVLGQKSGKYYTKAAVTKKLWSLREALTSRGVNPCLVQTNLRRGRRFALRQPFGPTG